MAFRQWLALATNRAKRHRSGSFLVQGVQPLDVAIARDWPFLALLHTAGTRSRWADGLLSGPTLAPRIVVADALLGELGGKGDGVPEVVGVAAIPNDDLARIGPYPNLVVIADRPSSPGNLGTLLRSADALGAQGVVISGHAVDPYDPRVVRASRGSLFAVPTVAVAGPEEAVAWAPGVSPPRARGGSGEAGTTPRWGYGLRPPTAVVVGNEAAGMSRAWTDACSVIGRIPMNGAASSLNAAIAGSLVLYEAARQRRCPPDDGRTGS